MLICFVEWKLARALFSVKYHSSYNRYPDNCRHCKNNFKEDQIIISKYGGVSKYYCIPCAKLVHIIDDDIFLKLEKHRLQSKQNVILANKRRTKVALLNG